MKHSLLRTLLRTLSLHWKSLQAPSKNPSKKHLVLKNLLRSPLRVACGCMTPLVCTLSKRIPDSESAIGFLLTARFKKKVVSKRVVLVDVPPERKPERGYVRRFPRMKTGTRVQSDVPPEPERLRVRSPKPPFYQKPPVYLPVTCWSWCHDGTSHVEYYGAEFYTPPPPLPCLVAHDCGVPLSRYTCRSWLPGFYSVLQV